MKFEEALTKMREGAKIRQPDMPVDEYYLACYVTINPLFCPDGIEAFEVVRARGMSICWMQGDFQHPDMGSGRSLEYLPKENPCKHGYQPQISILRIMQDDWEVME